jgi:hypothetical protein
MAWIVARHAKAKASRQTATAARFRCGRQKAQLKKLGLAGEPQHRLVKCELAHKRLAPFRCRILSPRRVQAMIQQPAKSAIPEWLTIDVLIILVGLAIVGIGIWIAP